MTRKTLKDCAACQKLSRCDAHVSGGSWKHLEGVDPCQISLSSPEQVLIDAVPFDPKKAVNDIVGS